jgi:hypothetical protein
MSFAKPLTELTTIWLDNIINGVPPGDVTGCSPFVIVPCHGHSATWHSITFIGEVLFLFLCEAFFMVLIEWSLVDTTTINMSSKDIASHVPMFAGQDFRFWKESMTDYLGAQRLLGYALGQRQRPVAADVAQPTQAELAAQAEWDEIDLQVRSMISMRLSTNLRTLIGTTSMATWTNLEQRYGVPHFTGIYKDYELVHSIKLSTGENPEIRIQKIWTILERLQANRCNLNNYYKVCSF